MAVKRGGEYDDRLLESMHEQQVLDVINGGSGDMQAAFTYLEGKLSGRLHRVANKQLLKHRRAALMGVSAEDCVQQTWLQALGSISKASNQRFGSINDFAGFLFTILSRITSGIHRSSRRQLRGPARGGESSSRTGRKEYNESDGHRHTLENAAADRWDSHYIDYASSQYKRAKGESELPAEDDWIEASATEVGAQMAEERANRAITPMKVPPDIEAALSGEKNRADLADFMEGVVATRKNVESYIRWLEMRAGVGLSQVTLGDRVGRILTAQGGDLDQLPTPDGFISRGALADGITALDQKPIAVDNTPLNEEQVDQFVGSGCRVGNTFAPVEIHQILKNPTALRQLTDGMDSVVVDACSNVLYELDFGSLADDIEIAVRTAISPKGGQRALVLPV